MSNMSEVNNSSSYGLEVHHFDTMHTPHPSPLPFRRGEGESSAAKGAIASRTSYVCARTLALLAGLVWAAGCASEPAKPEPPPGVGKQPTVPPPTAAAESKITSAARGGPASGAL